MLNKEESSETETDFSKFNSLQTTTPLTILPNNITLESATTTIAPLEVNTKSSTLESTDTTKFTFLPLYSTVEYIPKENSTTTEATLKSSPFTFLPLETTTFINNDEEAIDLNESTIDGSIKSTRISEYSTQMSVNLANNEKSTYENFTSAPESTFTESLQTTESQTVHADDFTTSENDKKNSNNINYASNEHVSTTHASVNLEITNDTQQQENVLDKFPLTTITNMLNTVPSRNFDTEYLSDRDVSVSSTNKPRSVNLFYYLGYNITRKNESKTEQMELKHGENSSGD